MTLLVKDEADIIEANIRTHAKLGVDAFIVMDNGSSDGTREIVEHLRQEYEITLIEQPSTAYKQRKWVTQMCRLALKKYKADWVINCDADEFWIPLNKPSLKDALRFKGATISIKETNMIPTAASWDNEKAFFNFAYEVVAPVMYDSYNKDEVVSNIFAKAGPKSIVNPRSLLWVNNGNHTAEHLAFWAKKRSEKIHIFQYPIRNFKRFVDRIDSYKKIVTTDPSAKIGKHWKRWIDLYDQGKIEEEYARFVLSDDEIKTLERIGIIRKNPLPSKVIVKI